MLADIFEEMGVDVMKSTIDFEMVGICCFAREHSSKKMIISNYCGTLIYDMLYSESGVQWRLGEFVVREYNGNPDLRGTLLRRVER